MITSVVIALVVCAVGFYLYQFTQLKLFTPPPTVFATIAATIFSITAGFSILIAFTRFQDLKGTINQEVICMGDILDMTQYVEGQDLVKEKIVNNVKHYGVSVAHDEWPHMADGQPNNNTSVLLERVMQSINDVDLIKSEKNKITFGLLVERVIDITTFRSQRLKKAKETFPQLLLVTLYTVSIGLVVGVFLLLIPNLFFQLTFLAAITFIATLIIQLVNDIGNPYKPGVWSVSKDDYETVTTSILSQVRAK